MRGTDDRILDEVGRGAGLTLAFWSGLLDHDSYDIAGLIRLGVLPQLNVHPSRLCIWSPRSSLVRKQRARGGDRPRAAFEFLKRSERVLNGRTQIAVGGGSN